MRITNPVIAAYRAALPVIAGSVLITPGYRRLKRLCVVKVNYYEATAGLRGYRYELTSTHPVFEFDGEMELECVVKTTGAVVYHISGLIDRYSVKVILPLSLSTKSRGLIYSGLLLKHGKQVSFVFEPVGTT